MKTIGIYRLFNKITGRSYIGQSIDIEQRIKNHQHHMKNPKRGKSQKAHFRMSDDYYIHGSDSFDYEILEETTLSKLYEREEYWMDMFEAHNPAKSYHVDSDGRKHPLAEPVTPKWYLEYEREIAKFSFGVSIPYNPKNVFELLADNITYYGAAGEVSYPEEFRQRIIDLNKILIRQGHKSPIRLDHLEAIYPMIVEYDQLLERKRKLYSQLLHELGIVAGLDEED
jgi:hypothetical protein